MISESQRWPCKIFELIIVIITPCREVLLILNLHCIGNIITPVVHPPLFSMVWKCICQITQVPARLYILNLSEITEISGIKIVNQIVDCCESWWLTIHANFRWAYQNFEATFQDTKNMFGDIVC